MYKNIHIYPPPCSIPTFKLLSEFVAKEGKGGFTDIESHCERDIIVFVIPVSHVAADIIF